MNRNLCLIVIGLYGMVPFAGRAASLAPSLNIMRCAQPPLVDGVLTDACWQTPAMITSLCVLNTPGKTRTIRAWVAQDDAWLYFAADIPHPAPQHIKQDVRGHNGPVASDDSLELFIDPGTDGMFYLQYMLNALNVGAEKYVARKSDHPNPGWLPWRSGAAATPAGWSAEIAVPMAFLATCGDLSQCRFNLNVNLIIPTIDPNQVRVDENREFLSFAPVKAGFHEPEHFAWLRGLDAGEIRTPCFPHFSELLVSRYGMTNGNYFYGVAMQVAGAFDQPGPALIEVEDCPISGERGMVKQLVRVAGRSRQDVRLQVPVAALVERHAVVRLRNPDTGEIFQSQLLEDADMAALRLMSCYLDRSYYTTETGARAICEFSLPPEELNQLKVLARDAERKILAEIAPAMPETPMLIPLAGMAPGAYDLQVELCRTSGEKVAGQTARLIKRRPKPDCEWKVDRVNRVLLRNGTPYFGFGIVVPVFNDVIARDIAAAGLDHVCVMALTLTPGQAEKNRRLAEQHGLYLMDYLDGYVSSNAPITFKLGFKYGPMAAAAAKMTEAERRRLFEEYRPKKLELTRQIVAELRDSPNVMGYFSIDEPGCHPETPDMPARGRDLYRAANEADGYHPLFVNFSSHINAGNEWTDWTDVLGADPYWITAGKVHQGTPNLLSKITAATDRRAQANRQPCWIIPMAAYWSGTLKRPITRAEQFCQTYLALIHGAKIITYFYYPALLHQDNYDALRDLAFRMKTLGPIMLTPAVSGEISHSPVEWAPGKGLYPSVQAVLRARPEGGYVLICANSKWHPVDASFRLEGLEFTAGTVGELFDPELKLSAQDGGFRDTFEPFGVRAYAIPAKPAAGVETQATGDGSSSQAPIRIFITAADHPEQAAMEAPELPRSGRPGKKNLAANPSFESQSLPGLPDYYYYLLGYHHAPPSRCGSANASYTAVTDNPFHGKYCVRLAGRGGATPAQVRFHLAPVVEQDEQFTLSVYMRADRAGVKGGLGSVGMKDWTTIYTALSTNWQRVSVSGKIPPGLSTYHQFCFMAPTDDSAVWLDAIQLERGPAATEFEP